MQHGLKKIPYKSHKTYDWNRTFGVIEQIPSEFNMNVLKLFPNQNAEGFPQACTAYSQTAIASNEDNINFDDVEFTYRKTLGIDGSSFGQPCNIMSSFKACTAYGVKRKEDDEKKALDNRRAPYFIVKKTNDYYDAILSAMWIKQGGISIGTPWLPWFEAIGQDGVIPPMYIDPKMNFVNGHNWIAYGQKIVNGEPRLICVSHQGQNYGNGGECYFSRDQINKLLSIKGSGAFGQKHATPEDIRRVEMNILEVALSLIMQFLMKIKPTDSPIVPTPKIIPPVAPQTQPEPVKEPKKDLLKLFCDAIVEMEGGPGDQNHRLNNPGNCRYSAVGYASKYGVVKRSPNGFAIFKDWDTGYLYLKNLVLDKAERNPIQTCGQFFSKYAPFEDSNNPVEYARFVIKRMGVDEKTFKMGDLIV